LKVCSVITLKIVLAAQQLQPPHAGPFLFIDIRHAEASLLKGHHGFAHRRSQAAASPPNRGCSPLAPYLVDIITYRRGHAETMHHSPR
jgi:hypothetical protein